MYDSYFIDKIAMSIFKNQCLHNKWIVQETGAIDHFGIDSLVIPTENGKDLLGLSFYIQLKGSMDEKRFLRGNFQRESISQQLSRKRLMNWIREKEIPIMICVVDIKRWIIYWEFIHKISEKILIILNKKGVDNPTIKISTLNDLHRDQDKIIWEIQQFKGHQDTIIPQLYKNTDGITSLEDFKTHPSLISLIRIGTNESLKRVKEMYKRFSEENRKIILYYLRYTPNKELIMDFLLDELNEENYSCCHLILGHLLDFGTEKYLRKAFNILDHFQDQKFRAKRKQIMMKLGIE